MTLPELLAEALGRPFALPAVPVTGVAQDHRKVTAGSLFVARRGARFDGHRYMRLAIDAGAVAVVGSRDVGPVLPWRATPYVRVEDDRLAVARLAAAFHRHPSRDLATLGVTGTDGKTTVSFLLHHLLSSVDDPCGLISTAAVRSADAQLPVEGHFTTPEATEVQAYLARFRDDGCSRAVLESSSHALASHRLEGVEYDVGVWTNLTPEHLDFHGSMEGYRNAKLELVRRSATAVLNADDPHFEAFAQAAAGKVVSYGLSEGANWRAEDIEESPEGLSFALLADGRRLKAALPMIGSFNVHNALAALAAASSCGKGLEFLLERLARFPGVPGRMQKVQSEPFTVVVDFAHTPPALEKALAVLRPVTRGRLIVVLGAAGERDPGKRRPLGKAAALGADLIFFTEEDHRSESLEAILDELEQGAAEGGVVGASVRRIPDRGEAIAAAIAEAREGDLVLLAGKGPERTLERGDQAIPWDEAAEAVRHLRNLD